MPENNNNQNINTIEPVNNYSERPNKQPAIDKQNFLNREIQEDNYAPDNFYNA